MKATAKDLRFKSKELIEMVKRGEEIVITFRGKPCAKLVPFGETKNMDAKQRLFGIWRDNEAMEDIDAFVRNLRKGRFR